MELQVLLCQNQKDKRRLSQYSFPVKEHPKKRRRDKMTFDYRSAVI